MPYRLNVFTGNLDYYKDPDLSAYATQAWANANHLKLDQATPQIIINGVPLMTTAVDEYGSGNQLVNMAYVRGGTWLMPPIIEWFDPTEPREGFPEGGLPEDPEVGDRYGCDGTGYGWTYDYIYEWDGEEWVESEPEEGWIIWELFGMILWFFFSGGWGEVGTGSYWSLWDSQMGIEGDKSGSFNLTTTGTLGAGAITGTSLIKSGGISSQFLKADGSVDTSTYLTDIVNDTTPQLGGDLDGQSLYDLNNIVDAEFEGTIGVGTTPGTTAIISAIKSMNGTVAFGVSGSITGTRSNGDMINLRGLSYIATYTPDNLVSTARKVTNLDGAFATATIASKDGETVNISATFVQGYRSALSAIVGSGASGTVNVVSGSHYRAPDATVGNGGTFTTLRAFYDLGQTVATTNWGFYGLTANNYLSGGLQIGGTAAVGQTAGYLYFRDSAINIASIDDGHLDLTADVSIDLNGLTLSQNIVPITDDTYYLGEIGSPFKAYKALILKDTTNGSHYSITIVNGVITTIALD